MSSTTVEAGRVPPAIPDDRQPGIHQFVPALIPRDATGSHTLLLRRALREAGWRSEIYAEATHDELLGESRPVAAYAGEAVSGDVLVYQCSTSWVLEDWLADRPEPLVLDYHNITDPGLSVGWEPGTVARATTARRQLAELAPRAVLGLCDSPYNEQDLRAVGCRRTVVAPVLVDLERLVHRPDPRVAARLAAQKAVGGADWLFVGRLVPSKAQHQLVKALWAYRRLYDPQARLHLVGAAPSVEYLRALREFLVDLELAEAVRITGEVSDASLAAHYAAADVYVSLSVHEGFGVPLVEAMRTGVPVVAFDQGAVAGTVGGAGLVIEQDEPSYVAAAVHRVLADGGLREHLVAAGHRHAGELTLARTAAVAVDALAQVAAETAVGRGGSR